MKQILVVLLLTALVLAGYVATRLLTESSDPPPIVPTISSGAGTGTASPTAGAPTSPTAAGPGTPKASAPVVQMAAPLADRVWNDAAHGDFLPAFDALWEVDLSGVDLEADVLVRYEGGEVTRDEFRRAVVSTLANALVESMAALEITRHQALASGLEPVVFDPELLDRRFEFWCRRRGIEAEQGLNLMALQFGLPPAAARRFFDVSGQVALASSFNASREEALLTSFLTGIEGGQNADVARQLLDRIETSWAELQAGGEGAEEALVATLNLLEQLALLRVSPLRAELGRRVWSDFDHPLPDGSALGVALEPVPTGGLPWESGAVAHLSLDEVWGLLEGGFPRPRLERVLADLLFFEVVENALRAADSYESDADAWRLWIDDFEAQSTSILGPRMVVLGLFGFPSFDVYRALERLQRGYERLQPEGWRSEDALREFYERNRMFIESWSTVAVTALFPAQPPEDPSAPADWDAALAEAQAFLGELEAGGDFVTLATAHSDRLRDRYREGRGDQAANEFAAAWRNGRLAAPLNEIGDTLKIDYYRRLVEGGGALYTLVAAGRDGAVHGPARSPLGYLLLQVERVALPTLEREYEDMQAATWDLYRDFGFMGWSNGLLREAGLPGQGS